MACTSISTNVIEAELIQYTDNFNNNNNKIILNGDVILVSNENKKINLGEILIKMEEEINDLKKFREEALPIINKYRNEAALKIQQWYRWHWHLKPNAIIMSKIKKNFYKNAKKQL